MIRSAMNKLGRSFENNGGGGGGGAYSHPSMLAHYHQAHSDYNDLRGHHSMWSAYSIRGYVMLALAWILVFCTLPVSLFLCIKIVHDYKRMVVFRLGRLRPNCPLGPGIVLVLPCVDEHHLIDMRTHSYDVPSQEMLTLDSVTVSVDAAVYFRTFDPVATITCVLDANLSTRQLSQTTLRNVLGTRTLTEIMSDREGIAHQAQAVLDEGTDPWGIKVERVEVKDIRLPRELTRVLAAEAEASREADAKIVSATGELNAASSLKAAADRFSGGPNGLALIMSTPSNAPLGSTVAVQLRYLQTLCRISASRNQTIIIPIPMELIRNFLHRPKKADKGSASYQQYSSSAV